MATTDRKRYEESSITFDEDFLEDVYAALENKIEIGFDIEVTDSITLHVSDRNKYVGSTFYRSLAVLPKLKRTIGQWLNPNVEFDAITLPVNNSDGRFNKYLPGGSSFSNITGRPITAMIGIAEDVSTYKNIWKGKTNEEVNIERTQNTIEFKARDSYSFFENEILKDIAAEDVFSNITDNYANKLIPLVYGDWETTNIGTESIPVDIPVIILNGNAGSGDWLCTISIEPLTSIGDVYYQRGDTVTQIPNIDITKIASEGDFTIARSAYTYEAGDLLWCSCTGKELGTAGADTSNPLAIAKDILAGMITDQATADADSSGASHLNTVDPIFTDDMVGKKVFNRTDSTQGSIVTFVSSTRVILDVDTSTWDDDTIEVNSGIDIDDFASTWDTEIATVRGNKHARIIIEDNRTKRFTLASSILEQFRYEIYVNSDFEVDLFPLQLDRLAAGSRKIKQHHIKRNSFKPRRQDKIYFNAARAEYNFSPANEAKNKGFTPVFKQADAVAAYGKVDGRQISFPNLYIASEVEDELYEYLRLSSVSGSELLQLTLTWRHILIDIGEIVVLNYNESGNNYEDVPCIVRDIEIDPEGFEVTVKLWSLQMTKTSTYDPGHPGMTGGYNATIEEV